jgi:hypothetical protein
MKRPASDSATLNRLAGLMARGGGCPVCNYQQERGRHFLEGLLYESVNDIGLRQQLEGSLGFCHRHSRAMLQISGGRLGAAILEQAMLKEALRRLDARGPSRRKLLGGRRTNGEEAPGTACLVCAREQEAARRALEELMGHWDASWAEALENSGGLCYNHLQQALTLAPDRTTRDQLAALHARVWRDLIARLDAFIRKHDYRFRDEVISDEESRAIIRAVAILTGEDPSW